MLSFESDYTTGAHPAILKRLMDTNLEAAPGYGDDIYCQSAKEKIRGACSCPEAEVWFLTGGTQTNEIVISTMLQGYEGVVAAASGHVNVHEAGAIEHTGHKVLSLPQHDGKLDADELAQFLQDFYSDENYEHMVFPGMVYISYPTEYGTLYTRAELERLSGVCRSYHIPLYMDGARLGYGLMSLQSDLTLPDVARLCDVFYIGGTKVGALCGEAVVFTRENMPPHFLTLVKQKGALLAKGRLLGIQFDVLFTDDLYWKISRHAVEMAERLKVLFHEKGIRFYLESPTNQQFVIFENSKLDELKKQVAFSFWEKADESHTIVQFATSWSTTEEDIACLADLLPEKSQDGKSSLN
ncbi:MAG: beta-eliminating lyase-related protein [Lachnospiraceae bacterium]|nr:beta-eliminating lyase-related protein [Lachnospiraceae bacterium]